MSVDFLSGAVFSVVLGLLLRSPMGWARARLSRYLVSRGWVPLPCVSCGRTLNEGNLAGLERLVRLAERTDHYVELSFQPGAVDPWRLVAKVTRGSKVDLFVEATFDETVSRAEYAAQKGGAYVPDVPRAYAS